jgi:bifunctional UDP-N-acetylglucosamine pyrophosphorylase/glucosamine-1-phosphate N-acetyltransferase
VQVPTGVIVLAAGGGTRMKSKLPKVLHPLCGRSMVGHVLAAINELSPQRLVAVVGHGRDEVGAHILELAPEAVLAVQETQKGTAHAVSCGLAALGLVGIDTIVVTSADTPLLEAETLRRLVADHTSHGRAITVLTGRVPNPFGYGRIVRDENGVVTAIVEEKDATDEQRGIREINSGIFAFDASFLAAEIGRVGNGNAKGEYYLTDLVGMAVSDGLRVGTLVIEDVAQTEGANDREQLAGLAAEMNRRILGRWMRDGVTIIDPATTWIDVTVSLEPDATILAGVQLLGSTSVAESAVVGPDSTLTDVIVGAGASVVRTHAIGAEIGADATVGPFSYLRPGTVLGVGGKIGGFVETKNARIGAGAKVPHLSYVGDAEIGDGTNIGAGTIFANYDGVSKHRTRIGKDARTGSNNTLIAPVEIGDGAMTGGGTVVRRDVPPGALAVSGGPQRNFEGWVVAHRPETSTAAAAEAAASSDGHGVAEPPHREGESAVDGGSEENPE